MEVKLMTKLNHQSQMLLHKWRIHSKRKWRIHNKRKWRIIHYKSKKKLNPQNNNNNDLIINLLIIRKVRRLREI